MRERCNKKGCPYHLKFPSVGRHHLLQILFHSIDPPILQNTHILRCSLEQWQVFHYRSNLKMINVYLLNKLSVRQKKNRKRRKSTHTHTHTNQWHRPCIEFKDKRTTSGKISRTNLTLSQNQNCIKAQLKVAEYVDIYHPTNCFINCSTATFRRLN